MKRMANKMAAMGLALTLALTAAGCSDAGEKSVGKTVKEGEKVVVYTTFQAQGNFVQEIGGDKVEVSTFMPIGQNFWQWAPTLKDMRDLEKAHIMVLNGNNVEDRWWDQTYATVKIKNKDLLVVDASEGIEELDLLRYYNPDASEEDQAKKRFDPWHYLDPQNAKHEVDALTDALSKKAPAYADEFKKNAEAYKVKLDELDKKYADTLAKVKRKEIVSPYPAFQYLAKRYGLKYYVPTSIAINDYPMDHESDMQAVKDDFAKHDAAVIFFEGEAAPRVQEFLYQIGYRASILNPYEGKTDPSATKGYIKVMEENLAALEAALNQ
ncbi:zinc transport system substrate-binding protein [Tumebacillus sp. BK434]|uniref:metal ABC transporter solute-binding protein, Zn/Mn family n=1 Tax=Tumebacillus sp. BK434 TaxID=2512169 RepID=UPI00104479C2|nr:zinc ABC transporter substrate-binding protein [Tumebacillus sp. BK434]TCP55910.1 zinc transport system substrate-binding protein [Tumebacillus sp. BK434]